MLSDNDKKIIRDCARKYKASAVILFGSASVDRHSQDIDLGVKGIEGKYFFKMYADLFKNLSKSVDLVDLSKKSSFTEYVEKKGVTIYE
jgi:predicted nucleotidyltransferase